MCSRRFASIRSPIASFTSASRCRLCASPAVEPISRCSSTASLQLGLGEREIASQQEGLTAQRGGEGNRTQHPGTFRGCAQSTGKLEDLLVRGRAVEQEFRDAQMRIEDAGGQFGLAHPLAKFQPESLGPFAFGVRQQALQSDQVEPLPLLGNAQRDPSRACDAAASAASRSPLAIARCPCASRSSASSCVPLRVSPSSAIAAVSRSPAMLAARASLARSRERSDGSAVTANASR